jgi:hypothetical protein
MSKSSKKSGYTGRMHSMNKLNVAKDLYDSNKSRSLESHAIPLEYHCQHKKVYPEIPAEQRIQKCTCKK